VSQAKPFSISKKVVWEAYERIKANKGAAGVDSESIEAFEQDRKNNLYRIWNRMSSGTYFPPPVFRHLNDLLVRWAMRKYKCLRRHHRRAARWLVGVAGREPRLLAHWDLLGLRPGGRMMGAV